MCGINGSVEAVKLPLMLLVSDSLYLFELMLGQLLFSGVAVIPGFTKYVMLRS